MPYPLGHEGCVKSYFLYSCKCLFQLNNNYSKRFDFKIDQRKAPQLFDFGNSEQHRRSQTDLLVILKIHMCVKPSFCLFHNFCSIINSLITRPTWKSFKYLNISISFRSDDYILFGYRVTFATYSKETKYLTTL